MRSSTILIGGLLLIVCILVLVEDTDAQKGGRKGGKGGKGKPGGKDDKDGKGKPGGKDDKDGKGKPGDKDDKGGKGKPGGKDDKDGKGKPGGKDDKGGKGKPGGKDDKDGKGEPGGKDDKGGKGKPGGKDDKDGKGKPGGKDDKGGKGKPGGKDDKDGKGKPGGKDDKDGKGKPGGDGGKDGKVKPVGGRGKVGQGKPGGKGGKGNQGKPGGKEGKGGQGKPGGKGGKGGQGKPGGKGRKGGQGKPGGKGGKGGQGKLGKSRENQKDGLKAQNNLKEKADKRKKTAERNRNTCRNPRFPEDGSKRFKLEKKYSYQGIRYICKLKDVTTKDGRTVKRGRGKKIGCIHKKIELTPGQTKTIEGKTVQCKGKGDKIKKVVIKDGKKTTTEVRPATEGQSATSCRLSQCKQLSLDRKPNCHASGDPHYTTFDGLRHHYQGTCKLTAVKPLDPTKGPQYSISVKTEYRSGKERVGSLGKRVSFVKWVEVKAYGQTVRLGAGVVLVNGKRVTSPWFFPLTKGDPCKQPQPCQIAVQRSGSKGNSLTLDFGIAVKYDGNSKMDISLPNSKDFKQNTGGLCGYWDGNPKNDQRTPDGTVEKSWNDFGESWIEPDPENEAVCTPEETDPCVDEKLANAEALCALMQDPDGPFSGCMEAAPQMTKGSYQDCVFDMCIMDLDEKFQCEALEVLGKKCQAKFSGAPIKWRSDKLCPPQCGENMHFDECAEPLLPTCDNPGDEAVDAPGGNCESGCTCDEGFVFDEALGHCIPLSNCGCIDDQNNYRKDGEKWLSPDCGEDCSCTKGGEITCITFFCALGEECAITDEGNAACGCKEGYEKNNKGACEDINECKKTENICGKNAECKNTDGSFECGCKEGFVKDDTGSCRKVPPPPTKAPPCTDAPPPPIAPGCTANKIKDEESGCITGYNVQCRPPPPPPPPPTQPPATQEPPIPFCATVKCAQNSECDDEKEACICKEGFIRVDGDCQEPKPPCPVFAQVEPPKYCFYLPNPDKDDGCPSAPSLACASPPLPTLPPGASLPPLPPKPTSPPPPEPIECEAAPQLDEGEKGSCEIDQNGVDENGCPVYEKECFEKPTPPPQRDPPAPESCEEAGPCVDENSFCKDTDDGPQCLCVEGFFRNKDGSCEEHLCDC